MKSVLIVDDDAGLCRSLARLIQSSEVVVELAHSYDEAMVALATHTPDVVLTDVDLRGERSTGQHQEGLDLLDQLVESGAKTKRYVMTGSYDPIVLHRARHLAIEIMIKGEMGVTKIRAMLKDDQEAPPSTDRVRDTLAGALSAAKRFGYKAGPLNLDLRITNGKYTAKRGAALCPIGALLLNRPTVSTHLDLQFVWNDAAAILGVTPAWVDVFQDGFMDDEMEEPELDWPLRAAWDLGQDFRAECLSDVPNRL
jgi:CheY-like chemotaxis protein